MSNVIRKSIQYGQHTLTLETGEVARQAGGAVMVSLADGKAYFQAGRPSGYMIDLAPGADPIKTTVEMAHRLNVPINTTSYNFQTDKITIATAADCSRPALRVDSVERRDGGATIKASFLAAQSKQPT